jgi:hypothetical protein
MNELEQAPAVDRPMPNRTTPTWEMELLVSGATVFGLFQLPALADRLLFGFYNSSNFAVATLTPSLWVYVKFALLTLIATFIAHLCLRGYWVALVGLSSVYPEGFRWDRMKAKIGPHYLATSRELTGDIDTMIERADNRASIVFGLGFGMASMMLMPVVLVAALMAIAWLHQALGGDGVDALKVAAGAIGIFFVLFAVLVYWDKSRGATLPADSRGGRRLRRFFRFYSRMGFDRASNPLISLFSSNEGNGRTASILGIAMAVVFAIVVWQVAAERQGWSAGDFAGLPDDVPMAEDTILPQHYASLRGTTARLEPLPHIPDPVVRGNYLRLFVPYMPARHNEVMAERCPAALTATGDDAVRVRLACVADIHAVEIDGQPVDIRFDAAEDPATGQRGMIAMIPVHDLALGRHELTLLRARTAKRQQRDGKPMEPYRIPFWR